MKRVKFDHYKMLVLIINYTYILSGICMLGLVIFTLCSFKTLDPPEKQEEVVQFIKDNMNKIGDLAILKALHNMELSGDVEYVWNKKTGEVYAYDKRKVEVE